MKARATQGKFMRRVASLSPSQQMKIAFTSSAADRISYPSVVGFKTRNRGIKNRQEAFVSPCFFGRYENVRTFVEL